MTGQLRAAIYCRISDDRRGSEVGVTTQREDCLALVEREGWTLVHDGNADTFTDNDISASSGRRRPAYERLVKALRVGEVDVVVAKHPYRLHRSTRELEDFIDLQEATRTDVVTVQAGLWNLSTAAGRMSARIMGAVGRGESEEMAERIRRRMLANAEQGKVHGALRTYGLDGTRKDDGTHSWKVVKEEAAVIREAAERVLAGETLLSVVRDFNARGVTTLRGREWTRGTLRTLLISARIAGWREHTTADEREGRGEHEKRKGQWPGGEFVAEGEWPAILSRTTVERLRRVLNGGTGMRRVSTRSYLLSGGLLRCQCGQPMRGRVRHNNGQREYACASPLSNGRGCGKVSIKAEHVEDYVVRSARAAVPEMAERLRRDAVGDVDAAWREVAEREADLTALADDHGRGTISRAEWMAARRPLQARLEGARADLDRQRDSGNVALLATGKESWDARWADATEAGAVDRQRTLLALPLDRVTVSGVRVRGRNTFDPDRVELEWRW